MRWLADLDHRIAAGLFLLSLIVYGLTMSPTISFWDCAEFVTVAHILGIPHQPGTPLYVLVGKVFSLLPLGLSVAHKINLMSAFFSALAVAFMYLTGVRLQRNWHVEKTDPSPAWILRAGAASGALFLAFSNTFWNNAIEAEVYALAAFTLAFVSFLTVYWWEIRERVSSATLMLLIVYLLGLTVGFHMGSIVVGFGVFVLILLDDKRQYQLPEAALVVGAIAGFGLTALAAGMFGVQILGTLIVYGCVIGLLILNQKRAAGVIDTILVALAVGGFLLTALFKVPDGIAIAFLILAVLGAVVRAVTWGATDEFGPNRILALSGIALFFLGLSVHLFMLVRAPHDPYINQTDPTTWDAMMSVLQRDQYPPRSISVREAPLGWQIGHFLGTSIWQSGQLDGRRVIGLAQQFDFLSVPSLVQVNLFGKSTTVPTLNFILPTVLWLLGIVYQTMRHWRLSLAFLTSLLINSVGLLLLLNFNDHEVRDRDYFYFGFYQFAALFIGLGVGGFLRTLWTAHREKPLATQVTAALLVLLPVLPVLGAPFGHVKWHEHDRSDNWIAYTYAKNILTGLPPDAILATNGDNDTFPLWYLQEVEGYRRDVRVVNLSLINVDWYVKQLRDYEPSVPIAWTDEQIEGEDRITFRGRSTFLGRERNVDGSITEIRDKVMWHIVRQNQWERPIYYAITVPNVHIGMFVPFLEMKGMVYELTPESSEDGNPRWDADEIWRKFTEVYDFTSVVDEEGYADRSVYRDAQTSHLLRNYPAALSRVGFVKAREGDYDVAREALEMAFRLDPTFPVTVDFLPLIYLQSSDVAAAIDAGRRLLPHQQHPSDGLLNLGDSLLRMREDEAAVEWARELFAAGPDEVEYAQLLIRSLLYAGRVDEAEAEVEAWVARTGQVSAREEFERFVDELERLESEVPDSSVGPETDPEGPR